jgi:hypothetical protein
MMPTDTPEDTTDPQTPLEKRSDVELRWRLAQLKTLRWKEAAGHFVLIVVGVLVALFVDALRQQRNERQREAAYIADLRTDMDSTLNSLERSIGVNRETLGRAETMLRYLQSVDDVPEDSVRGWRWIPTNTFVPTTGTMRALFETGDLRLLSRDVRRSLTSFAPELQFVEQHVDHAVVDIAALNLLIREREEIYRRYTGSRTGPTAGAYTLDVKRMRSDPALRAAYSTGVVSTRSLLERLIELRPSVVRLQGVLGPGTQARK